MTPAALRRLAGMAGASVAEPDELEHRNAPAAAGPTLTLVSQPLRDVEEVVALLDGPIVGKRAPSRWLQKARRAGLQPDAGGGSRLDVVIEGRRCCMALIRSLDRRLAMLALPSRHTCPTCGAVYELAMAVREGRPHGR